MSQPLIAAAVIIAGSPAGPCVERLFSAGGLGPILQRLQIAAAARVWGSPPATGSNHGGDDLEANRGPVRHTSPKARGWNTARLWQLHIVRSEREDGGGRGAWIKKDLKRGGGGTCL